MENVITLQFKITSRSTLFILIVFFLCWHPRFLGSETLTLTTYYPAPYGGYASLLTTGQTLLARNGGAVGIGTATTGSAKLSVMPTPGNAGRVGIGTNNPDAPLEIFAGGLPGPGYVIKFNSNNPIEYANDTGIGHPGDGQISLIANGGDRLHVTDSRVGIGMIPSGPGPMLTVNGDMAVNRDLSIAGSLTGLCRMVDYGVNWGTQGFVYCNSNEKVVAWYGNGDAKKGIIYTGEAGCKMFPPTQECYMWISVGADRSGKMLCCRIN